MSSAQMMPQICSNASAPRFDSKVVAPPASLRAQVASRTRDDADSFVSAKPRAKHSIFAISLPRLVLGAAAATVTLGGVTAMAVASGYATGFLGYAAYTSFTTQTGSLATQVFAMCFWPGATIFAASICRRATRDAIFLGTQFSELYRTCKNSGTAAARHLAYERLWQPCANRTLIFATAAALSAALSMHPIACASLGAVAVGFGTLSLLSLSRGPRPSAAV